MGKITYQKLNKLIDKVEYTLDKYPESRDSDIELFARLCERFYPPFERGIYNWRDLAYAMHQVPALDHIARLRRMVVAKHRSRKYLPTKLAIAEARRINQDIWLAYAMHNPKEVLVEYPGSNVPEGFNDEGELI